MATEKPNDPIFRTVDLSAEIKKMYGPKWNAPETSYEFSSGRKFELRTGDAAIYETSPDFEA
jgi:hypothetical protein